MKKNVIYFLDTDSFLLYCEKMTKDDILEKIKDIMDFSNYPNDHKFYSDNNAGQLGFFKDELCGKSEILEFVGPRSKSYAMKIKDLKSNDIHEKKVCKGVTKAGRQKLTFEDYKSVIFNVKKMVVQQLQIQSKSHNISVYETDKVAFNSFDGKRWLFDCGLHTVPYGSKNVQGSCQKCSI